MHSDAEDEHRRGIMDGYRRRGRLGGLLGTAKLAVGIAFLPFRRRRRASSGLGDPDARSGDLKSLAAETARTVGQARISTLFRSKGEKQRRRAEALERATANAVEQLGDMKGLAMKMGQMMSYFNVLPEAAEKNMQVLQASVPGMDRELVAAAVEERLGGVPEKIFASFDYVPVGAASIGQVHRARLHDGRSVAVKLQYPGIAEAFEADLTGMIELASMTSGVSKMDPTKYLAILVDSFEAELDYEREAKNQRRLFDLYRGHQHVVIPEPIEELSGPRIFVSEFIDGHRFERARELEKADRGHLAEIMYRFAFGCVLNGFFSGDPHPGNYLFPANRRVCFLDFGMVMELTHEQAASVREVIAGGLSGRGHALSDGFRHIGLYPEDIKSISAEKLWDALSGVICGPVGTDAPSRYTPAEYRKSMEQLSNPTGAWIKTVTQSEHLAGWALIWLRYAAGALATISRLDATANWRHLVEEIVFGGEPSTEIGKTWGEAPGGAEFVGSRFDQKTRLRPRR